MKSLKIFSLAFLLLTALFVSVALAAPTQAPPAGGVIQVDPSLAQKLFMIGGTVDATNTKFHINSAGEITGGTTLPTWKGSPVGLLYGGTGRAISTSTDKENFRADVFAAQGYGQNSDITSFASSGAKTANHTGWLMSNSSTSSTASITKTGLDIQSTGTWNGASAINIGLNVNVTGGTTNYAAIFQGGNVGIGTTAVGAKLTLADHTANTGGIRFRTAATAVDLWSSGSDVLKTAAALEAGSYRVGTTEIITSGRVLRVADGTVSAPGLSFSSDTNVGIYRGGTDILKFVTAGVDRLTINASGDAIIGGHTIFSNGQLRTTLATGSDFYYGRVSGEATDRFRMHGNTTNGFTLNWGDGAVATDTNLYRSAASTLKTDGALVVGGALTVASCTGCGGGGGTGDVTGPASSTDNAVARFDLATGKVLQNSTVLIGDTGNVTGLGTLNTHTIPAGTSTFALLNNNLGAFAATTSAQLAGNISDETGSGVLVFGTSPTITTDITIPNAGLHLLDTNATHDLIIQPGSDLTLDRTLTITTGDAARTLTLNGNATISGTTSGTNTGDQTTSGTANRISVTNGSTNPTIDIASTYVGQASITTLGTITSGTWNGTDVAVADGGTGQGSFTANQLIAGGTTATGALQSIAAGTSGQILVSNGASLPSWQNNPAGWNVSGSNTILSTSTNNVGIGLTPIAKLHVQGNASPGGNGGGTVTTSTGTGTPNDQIVQGSLTQFGTDVKEGDTITISGQTRTVVRIEDADTLYVDAPFSPQITLATTAWSYQRPIMRGYNDAGATRLNLNSRGLLVQGSGTDNESISLVLVDGNERPRVFFADNGHLGMLRKPESGSVIAIDGGATATGTWQDNSDSRLKENINKISNVLENIKNINGVYYDWKIEEFPEKNFDPSRQLGLIAQEVEKVFPEIVSYDDEGYRSLAYGRFVAVLLEAIKEQQTEIESQEKEIERQGSALLQLQKDVQALKKAIKK